MAVEPEGRQGPEPVGGQLIIPVAGLLFTLYYFSTIIGSPWEAQVAAFFVGTILILLIMAFLIRTASRLLQGQADLGLGALFGDRPLMLKRLALFALTLGYLLLIDYLGFTITTFLFLSAAMLTLGANEKPLRTLGIAAAVSLAGWLLFIVAFDTRFPEGPFELLMERLL